MSGVSDAFPVALQPQPPLKNPKLQPHPPITTKITTIPSYLECVSYIPCSPNITKKKKNTSQKMAEAVKNPQSQGENRNFTEKL
ncbi:hypothetical protein Syun_021868 [Stephania yunnanensis]|uniref:Uncharacterized protein n=1 Tax=Stephania yunnanensis TaxID=152371 RepID=A0AAP0IGF5_9MAGN